MKKKFRGYIFSRPFHDERVPQNVQNLVIREFCKKKNFDYLLSKAEYSMKNSYSMLKSSLNEIKKIDGMVFYSLMMLPDDKHLRNLIFKNFINNKKQLYFALEDKKLSSKKDISYIEDVLMIKKTLKNCLTHF